MVDQTQIQALFEKLDREARAAGYILNPDQSFTLGLVEGLLVNAERYGYQACPCRLAAGERARDLDIICPCDYRDTDLDEYGACYCALYVSEAVRDGQQALQPIPDRRSPEGPAGVDSIAPAPHSHEVVGFTSGGLPIWRCKVCGYLCARPEPPLKCPICKADKDRFERFG